MRFLALDWETNGLRADPVQPLPHANYPVSVSIWAVSDDGTVEHLHSSRVSGATQFSAWATEHHPFTPEDLRDEPAFPEVVRTLTAYVQEGDVLVCHNIDHDLWKVLMFMCMELRIDPAAFINMPRVCTCKGPWASTVLDGKWLYARAVQTLWSHEWR